MYGGLFALFGLALVLNDVLPSDLFGMPRFIVVGASIIVLWYLILIKLIPKCPKCSMGMCSLIEFGYFPVIVKFWVSMKCTGCGGPLK
jgi:hypothetical protein